MKRPSASLVLSVAALFFSLSGAGLAAQHYLGAAGAGAGKSIDVYGKTVILCAPGRSCSNVGISTARCPNGMRATGGGWVQAGGYGFPQAAIGMNGPLSPALPNTWAVEMVNNDPITYGFQAVAVCAP